MTCNNKFYAEKADNLGLPITFQTNFIKLRIHFYIEPQRTPMLVTSSIQQNEITGVDLMSIIRSTGFMTVFLISILNSIYVEQLHAEVQCLANLKDEDYDALIELSNPDRLNTAEQARDTIKEIAEIFASSQDRRGIFTAMYVEITDAAANAIKSGEFQNSKLASELTVRFMQRYLEALRSHLLGEPFSSNNDVWKVYYKLAADCSKSGLRVLAAAVNAHLTFDLPYAVSEVEADSSFESDFMKFGDILIQRKSASTNRLWDDYGIDAVDFFDGFFIGKAVDEVFGSGTASLIGFQVVRSEAWVHSQSLQNPLLMPVSSAAIRIAWGARKAVLNVL